MDFRASFVSVSAQNNLQSEEKPSVESIINNYVDIYRHYQFLHLALLMELCSA